MKIKPFLIICVIFALQAKSQSIIENEYILHLRSDAQAIATNPLAYRSSQLVSYSAVSKSPLHLYTVKFSDDSTAKQWIQTMTHNADVLGIYPNHRIAPRNTPNDLEFSKQWQYINTGANNGKVGADMDMDLAWNLTTGGLTPLGDTIVVCVVDDGLNGTHPDLIGNIWYNFHEIPNNGVDDDGNGYIDDFRGYNVQSDDDNVHNGGSHGTSVSGIIGAKGNNGIGVSGINWNVKIMAVDYGVSDEAHALAAYAYPYEMRKLYNETNGQKGAFVVATNSSWGTDNLFAKDAPLWCSMYDLLGEVGIINVGATANDKIDVDTAGDMPTSCESEFLISVTNVNNKDIKVEGAGYGRKSIDLGSFGNQAYTLSQSTYGAFAGTSSATPHVTGVIALAYSLPCMDFINVAKSSPSQACLIVKDMLLNGSTYNETLQNITTTGGRINAFRTLQNMESLCSNCEQPAGITIDQTDNSITIRWVTNTAHTNVLIRYRQIDQIGWTQINNIQSGFVLKDLNFCTEYEVQLSSSCGNFVEGYGYSKFVKTAGCCEAPKPVTVIPLPPNSVQITWPHGEGNDYEVNIRPFDGEWQTVTLDTNVYNLDNLLFCSQLEIKVKSICKKYNSESLLGESMQIHADCGACNSNEYCLFSTKDNQQEWIDTVRIQNDPYPFGQSHNGYEFSTGKNMSILQQGQSYPFETKIGYQSNEFAEYAYLYADWNHDGIFDESEVAFESAVPTQNLISGKFTVPETALSGSTRLRVLMSYKSLTSPCDDIDFVYGQVADLCVQIADSNCASASEPTHQLNPDHSVTFTNTSSQGIMLLYKDSTELLWHKAFINGNLTIPDIDSCSVFQYKYAGVCDEKFSSLSAVKAFKTACINNTQDPNYASNQIYPNPAREEIFLNTTLIPSAVLAMDVTGKALPLSFVMTGNLLQVSLHPLHSGYHTLIIRQRNGVENHFPFIKID